MSSPRDSETEVNEKLLTTKPYNNNQHPHPYQQQQQQQQHHSQHPHKDNHNSSSSTTTTNGKAPSYHQYPRTHLSSPNAGTSSSNPSRNTPTNTMGSIDLKAAAAIAESTANNRYELERQVHRLKWFLGALFVACFIGFIVIIITFAILFVKFRHDLDTHTHKPKVGEQISVLLQHESLCVPCKDFTLGPSPEETRMLNTFSLKDSDQGLTCCVDTPRELLDLLKLFVERRFRQEMAKGTIKPWPQATTNGSTGVTYRQPVAAHLLMTHQDMVGISQIQGRQYTIGKWIHENDAAFTIGTSYQHGRIVIPRDGFYYVYSQISFMEYYTRRQKDAFDSRDGVDSPSLSHYLYRYNIHYHNGGEEKLAQNSITKGWGQSGEYGEYSSYLGAVFYLRNQDEVFIKVSNITMISGDPKLSYFGLFQI